MKNKQESINPLNGKTYIIPDAIDDSISIDEFVSKNNKPVIAVQGLGFVGAVMSLVCANSITEQYAVIGVDLPTDNSIKKINALNSGEFPLIAEDPKIDEFFKNSISIPNAPLNKW